MKKQKNLGKVLVIIAVVLSFMLAAVSAFCAVALSFNLWNIADAYMGVMSEMGYAITDVSSEISIMSIELGISALVNLLAGLKYIKIVRRGGIPRHSSPFSQVFLQVLFGSLIVGIIAMIGIVQIVKNRVIKDINVTKEEFHDYRMEAMTEAITRLKELKAQGAISEEEYYETLNKILES